MRKSYPRTVWFGLAAAVLMLVLFVLYFLPYWSYQGESVSLAGYIIRPAEHSTFTNLFRSYFGKKYRITLLFGLPLALTMVGSVLGSVLCVIRSSKAPVYLIPMACGAFGLYGLLANQPYKLSGLWLPMLILLALTLIAGIVGFIVAIKTPEKTPVQS